MVWRVSCGYPKRACLGARSLLHSWVAMRDSTAAGSTPHTTPVREKAADLQRQACWFFITIFLSCASWKFVHSSTTRFKNGRLKRNHPMFFPLAGPPAGGVSSGCPRQRGRDDSQATLAGDARGSFAPGVGSLPLQPITWQCSGGYAGWVNLQPSPLVEF